MGIKQAAKHTPGPWNWSGSDTHLCVFAPDERVLGINDRVIADIRSVDFEQSQADARLISTAPDLLEAIGSAIQSLKEGYPEEAARTLRAAIARAEGK